MEIRTGGGVFGLGNSGGRGCHSDPGNLGGRGGQKTLPSVKGGVDFFWNNPMLHDGKITAPFPWTCVDRA